MVLLVPFRNRDTARLEKGLKSLTQQSHKDFTVKLIDYGSNPSTARALVALASAYSFCQYIRMNTQGQLWNKSKALNYIIRQLSDGYVFVADADLIFAPDFVQNLKNQKNPNRIVYYKVGFLSKKASRLDKNFYDYPIKFYSEDEATGLSLFPVKALHEVGGFDEFFHFWGAEDTDVHNRLKIAGYGVKFYDKEVLLLHQYHPIYRAVNEKVLTPEPRLTHAVRLNHRHLVHNLENRIQHPNSPDWGQAPNPEQVTALQTAPVTHKLANRRDAVDHFLEVEWPRYKGFLKVQISEDAFFRSSKYWLKKLLGKNLPGYYSLKEINDKILLKIIGQYHSSVYAYEVDIPQKRLTFAMLMD